MVATETNELYYYSRQSKRFKSIGKLKVDKLSYKNTTHFFQFLGKGHFMKEY